MINFLMLISIPLVWEAIVAVIYGRVLSNKEVEMLMKRYRDKMWINSLETRIVCIDDNDGNFLAKIPFPSIAGYYFQNNGRVLRWTRGYRLIKDTYNQLDIG
jgi:hypothetical protein